MMVLKMQELNTYNMQISILQPKSSDQQINLSPIKNSRVKKENFIKLYMRLLVLLEFGLGSNKLSVFFKYLNWIYLIVNRKVYKKKLRQICKQKNLRSLIKTKNKNINQACTAMTLSVLIQTIGFIKILFLCIG